jgi:hypothetical protein
VWYSSLDVQMRCSETYGPQALSVILLVTFTIGFPIYILKRVGGGVEATGAGGAAVTQTKAARFVTLVRVAHIFRPEHRGWMAYLLLRRVALVVCFQIGETYGGNIPLPGTGGKIDWRVLPFFVVALFVLLQVSNVTCCPITRVTCCPITRSVLTYGTCNLLSQAWEKPFANALDNSLEQTTLTMLLCVLYANVALTQPSWTIGQSELLPNTVVLSMAIVFVVFVWTSQRQVRQAALVILTCEALARPGPNLELQDAPRILLAVRQY